MSTPLKIKIQQIRNVKLPSRGTPGSAGIDFYVPEDTYPDLLEVYPEESVNIPSGIKMIIPEGWCLVFFNKSGIATKAGLSVGAQVIDSDYRGEIHLHVFNNYAENYEIKPGQKLVQGLLIPVPETEIELVDSAQFDLFGTERGNGGFGSTGLM